MDKSLFKADFPEVSSREWMDKIVKDLRGKSLDSLQWKIDDSTIMEPYYTIHRNKEYDDPIHQTIIEQLRYNSWNIIQDLRDKNQEEVKKALTSDTTIIQLNAEDQIVNDAAIQCFIKDKSSLDSIKSKFNNINYLCSPLNDWINGVNAILDFSLLSENDLSIHLSSAAFHDAGADDFEEIGLLLASLNEYLHELNENNIRSKNIQVELCTGINFYSSIAKIRATRILIDQLLHLYPKLDISITLNAATSAYYTSHKDKHNNLLRHTTMALSAVIAGVDGLLVHPFEESNSFSLRMARNIQHILKEESYMDKVDDMMAGSYFFEELSIVFMDKAWNAFRKLEDEGGLIVNMRNGSVKKTLENQHSKRVSEYKDGTRTMIGINKYLPSENEQGSIDQTHLNSNSPWVLPTLTLSKFI